MVQKTHKYIVGMLFKNRINVKKYQEPLWERPVILVFLAAALLLVLLLPFAPGNPGLPAF
jgi:hypothetical protein